MSSLLADLRYALRLLGKQPAFTAVAVLVLALGIGANSAVFTLVNALLLAPRPGEGSERLVGLYTRSRVKADDYRAFSFPTFQDIRERNPVFEQVMAFTVSLVGVEDGDATRRVFGTVVSSNYFETLGVPLALGRAFTPEEERPGAGLPVVVISDGLWRRRGADPDVLGSTVTVQGRALTVVGVTRKGFTGTSSLVSPEVYLPLGLYEAVVTEMFRRGRDTQLSDRGHYALMLVGRLRPGMSVETAATSLDQLARQLEATYPAEQKDQTLVASPLSRLSISTSPSDDREMGLVSALLQAMAGSVLLIACLNLANMLLARGSARRKEIAIRQAIGGNRAQIVRQLLIEAFVLSMAGAVGGLVIAYWSNTLLAASLTSAFPISFDFDPLPDARVLSVTLLFAVISTLVFGLGPALRLSRADVLTDLREQASDPAPRGRLRLLAPRHLLVIAQVGLSLALLTAGGLFVRSALNAGDAQPGYPLDRGILVNVDPGMAGIAEARGRELYRTLLQRLRMLPGVEDASLASLVAFGDMTETRSVRDAATPRGPAGKDGDEPPQAHDFIVTSGYFRTLGLPILRGRDFIEGEEQSAGGPPVAIIDEPLARRLWPDEDPIGRRVAVEAEREGAPPKEFEVVGLVPGTRHDLFDRQPVPHLYRPFGSTYRGNMMVHVRGAGGGREAERALFDAVRQEIRAVDPRLPIVSMKSLSAHRDGSVMMWTVRTGGRLFLAFGLLALALAVVGLYGVKAYLVARRTREIGIRMALGATDGSVLWMVLREGLSVTVVGILVGLALAVAVGQVVASLLLEVSPIDPLIFVLAPLFLLATAALASYLPARRAARVTPITALREG